MNTSQNQSPLLSVTTDVLLEVFDLLPAADLASLAATSRPLNRLISGEDGEIIWRRKIAREFGFPVESTGRRQGWQQLYRRLHRGSAYVWGSSDNGRLGLVDAATRAKVIQGGLPSPTRLPLKQSIVGLESGGWGFHALTSGGEIVAWGQLNGEEFASPRAPLSNPGVIIHEPMVLPVSKQIGEVVQLQAGRKHVILKNRKGEVWEYFSFGRAYRVVDNQGLWGGVGKEVVAVEAGWGHSLVLTVAGDIFIWWEFGPAMLDRKAQEAGEERLEDRRRQGVTFTVETDTVRLPSLPTANSTAPSSTRPQPDKIVKIASTDHFVYALTQQSKVYRIDVSTVFPAGHQGPVLQRDPADPEDSPTRNRNDRDRLDAAFISGQRAWEYMSRFSELEDLGQLPAFASDATPTLTPPPPSTRISHISAHFQSFVVYSVPSSSQDSSASIVLLGTDETSTTSAPRIIPELQGKNVIKVAFGDYHYLALTSHGQLFSWGAYSSGALGLGHPQLLNTPLSAIHPPSPSSSTSTVPPRTTNHPLQAIRNPLFPGFTRGTAATPVPRAPEHVDRPTLVRYPGESGVPVEGEEVEHRTKGKFVFAVCASGWHSGALAVELGDEDEEEPPRTVPTVGEAETSGTDEQVMPGAFPQPDLDTNIPRTFANHPPFRIGFPGRFMNRGAGRGNPGDAAGGSN